MINTIFFNLIRRLKLFLTNKPNNLNTNVVSIEPQEGMLVLFPSYLHHSVDINQSEEDRIIISFNATLI